MAVIKSTRYTKSFQCLVTLPPSCDQLSCFDFCHTSDSFTRKRTKMARIAGRPPRKNMGRQPHRSNRKR